MDDTNLDMVQDLQTNNAVPSQEVPQASSASQPDEPFWLEKWFIILACLVFLPAGLTLYVIKHKVPKWMKILMGIFYVIVGVTIIIVGTTFLNVFTSDTKVDNSLKFYICKPINEQWGRCVNQKKHFSFEYPAAWHYGETREGVIFFSPSTDVVKYGVIVVIARDKDASVTNKLTLSHDMFSWHSSSDGKTIYDFYGNSTVVQENGSALSISEFQPLFFHMSESFTDK